MSAPDAIEWERYAESRNAFARDLREARSAGERVRLKKATSNLFRLRQPVAERAVDVSGFNRVIAVDREHRRADVGAMTPYDALVAATVPAGLVPAVVPELKSITVGGAVTGGGIESSSFRYGFVHESVVEMDILTASGEVLLCRPDNEHSDLFFGFANSYGTLGYALRVRLELVPAAPFVELSHRRYDDAEDYFGEMEALCRAEREKPDGAAFVDGTVFQEGEMYRTTGRWSSEQGRLSDYSFMRPFYRSIRDRVDDRLTTAGYIWRWDTDWFWCARAFGMENPVLRFLFGISGRLNSRTYWKLRNYYQRSRLLQKLTSGGRREWVIQDVEIPVDRAAEFQRFLHEAIGILPFWICPAMAYRESSLFPLYRTEARTLYINFGFWGGVAEAGKPGHHNRLVEAKVEELGGKKSLYSTAFYSEAEFWKHYNEPAYRALKTRYDPDGYFPDLYEKCVRGA